MFPKFLFCSNLVPVFLRPRWREVREEILCPKINRILSNVTPCNTKKHPSLTTFTPLQVSPAFSEVLGLYVLVSFVRKEIQVCLRCLYRPHGHMLLAACSSITRCPRGAHKITKEMSSDTWLFPTCTWECVSIFPKDYGGPFQIPYDISPLHFSLSTFSWEISATDLLLHNLLAIALSKGFHSEIYLGSTGLKTS